MEKEEEEEIAKATFNGIVLAKSDEYEMVEINVYFPPGSVNWDYLKPGDRQYTCAWKGKAAYYDIVVDDKIKKNAAWSYPETKEAAQYIKGYVAFEAGISSGDIQVER